MPIITWIASHKAALNYGMIGFCTCSKALYFKSSLNVGGFVLLLLFCWFFFLHLLRRFEEGEQH